MLRTEGRGERCVRTDPSAPEEEGQCHPPGARMIGRERRPGRPWVPSLLVVVTLTCCRISHGSSLNLFPHL